jgi:two-component system response regulator RstA
MKRMSTPQLLMIEDDTRLAQMVGEYLTRPASASPCPDAAGLHLLSSASRHAPDLVVLDLMLPDIDGLEVCRRIRALPGDPARCRC